MMAGFFITRMGVFTTHPQCLPVLKIGSEIHFSPVNDINNNSI